MRDRLLALKALAGTGKTYQLSQRYLELLREELENGRRIYDIVAITFTNKAANEMYLRILDFVEGEPLLKKTFLKEEVSIHTIDSLLSKILRKFSHFQEIRSDFEIRETLPLYEEFINSLGEEEFKRFLKFVERFNFSQNEIRRVLEDTLYPHDKEIEAFLQEIYKLQLDTSHDRVIQLFNQLVDIVQNNLTTKITDKFSPITKIEDLLFEPYPFAPKELLSKEELSQTRDLKRIATLGDEVFKELKRELKEFFQKEEKLFLKELLRFYLMYKSFRIHKARELNSLSFDDVRHLVYELLQGVDKDFLYFRLDNQISHLLIDEFQDTSLEDWSILEPLVDEIVTSSWRSFFYVGDNLQAIYSFRGGRAELFDYVALKYGMSVKQLDINYRSRSKIVEYVKKIYNLPPKYKANKEGGYVEVHTLPPRSKKEDILQALKEKLELLFKKGVRDEEIAILVRHNREVITISEFLSTQFNKKAVTSTSKLVINQLFPRAIISYLRYWQDPSNEIERFNFERVAKREFEKIPKAKPIEMIKEVATKFDILDESVMLLIENALPYNSLEKFLEEVESFQKESPKATKGIEVLTIHKSKGLSFPHTIVVDNLTRPSFQRSKLIFDYENVRLKEIRARLNNLALKVDDSLKEADEREKKREEREKLNVAYVALTRAKDSLIVLKREDSYTLFPNLVPIKEGEITISSYTPALEEVPIKKVELPDYGRQQFIKEEEEEYQPNNYNAIYLGNAYHLALETSSVEYAKKRYGFFVTIDSNFKERVKRAKEEIKRRFKGKQFKEIPFTFEGKLGMIDLLIVGEKEDIVIDYKSSTPQDEYLYLTQLWFYLEALESFKREAKGYLLYLDSMKFREVKKRVKNV